MSLSLQGRIHFRLGDYTVHEVRCPIVPRISRMGRNYTNRGLRPQGSGNRDQAAQPATGTTRKPTVRNEPSFVPSGLRRAGPFSRPGPIARSHDDTGGPKMTKRTHFRMKAYPAKRTQFPAQDPRIAKRSQFHYKMLSLHRLPRAHAGWPARVPSAECLWNAKRTHSGLPGPICQRKPTVRNEPISGGCAAGDRYPVARSQTLSSENLLCETNPILG